VGESEKFTGAVIIAVHHPPYVAVTPQDLQKSATGKHIGSPLMLADIDSQCESAEFWPHAILSGHAHNYQRFTRSLNGHEIPETKGRETYPPELLQLVCCSFISRRASGQGSRRRLRLRSCDQHRIRTSVPYRRRFSSETGKEGNAWNVVVY
jgi:hypothetical protein